MQAIRDAVASYLPGASESTTNDGAEKDLETQQSGESASIADSGSNRFGGFTSAAQDEMSGASFQSPDTTSSLTKPAGHDSTHEHAVGTAGSGVKSEFDGEPVNPAQLATEVEDADEKPYGRSAMPGGWDSPKNSEPIQESSGKGRDVADESASRVMDSVQSGGESVAASVPSQTQVKDSAQVVSNTLPSQEQISSAAQQAQQGVSNSLPSRDQVSGTMEGMQQSMSNMTVGGYSKSENASGMSNTKEPGMMEKMQQGLGSMTGVGSTESQGSSSGYQGPGMVERMQQTVGSMTGRDPETDASGAGPMSTSTKSRGATITSGAEPSDLSAGIYRTFDTTGEALSPTRSVPDVVTASQNKAHFDPEAAAVPEVVQEKAQYENELLSKVPESEATGKPAPTIAASTYNNTLSSADTVPDIVSTSQHKAHYDAEAAASPEVVREKSEYENELLSKVPESEAGGEPAPSITAATSAMAPVGGSFATNVSNITRSTDAPMSTREFPETKDVVHSIGRDADAAFGMNSNDPIGLNRQHQPLNGEFANENRMPLTSDTMTNNSAGSGAANLREQLSWQCPAVTGKEGAIGSVVSSSTLGIGSGGVGQTAATTTTTEAERIGDGFAIPLWRD